MEAVRGWVWIFSGIAHHALKACRDESVVIFVLPIFISRSTLTYRALYYGKIETQTSYIYIYIFSLSCVYVIN